MKKTKNYKWFTNHPQNRVTIQSHVQELKTKILKSNHLDANPIIVTDYDRALDSGYKKEQADPKYFVCQGAHRLQAAKELGLNIHYIYKPSLSSEDVKNLNSAKVWNPADWLEFHQDNPAYRELKSFNDTYKLSLTNGKTILSLNTHLSKLDFEDGLFKVPAIKSSIKIAQAINEMCQYLPKQTKKVPHSTRFVRYIIKAVKRDNFSLPHLVEQVQKYPHKVLSTPNEDMAKYVIETLYNHNAKTRDKFKVDQS